MDATGLLYYHARYYNPVLARFLSPDTLVPDLHDPQDLNRYSYVKNNPLNHSDPSGHCTDALTCGYEAAEAGTATCGPWCGAAAGVAVAVLVGAGAGYVLAEPTHLERTKPAQPLFQAEGDAEANTEESADTPHPLKQRADELHGLLDPVAQDKRTTGVTRATDADGNEVIIVGSSSNRLDPKQRNALKPGEIEAKGPGHAEKTTLDYAKEHGLTPHEVAASRPICPSCAEAIDEAGATPVSPLRQPRSE